MKPAEFDNWMLASDKAPSYRAFCKSVFNSDTCQFNMVGPDQRDILLKAIPLKKGMTALDAGCGTGWMCHWLHEQTGAHMVGMDTATAALDIADSRKKDADSDAVRFVHGDMTAPPLPKGTFDVVLCIDSLHLQLFPDLQRPVTQLAKLLKPGGAMVLFFNALIDDPAETASVQGETSPLAKVLSSAGYSFEYIDLADNDQRFWLQCRSAMQTLEDEFITDGIHDIFSAGWTETEKALDDIQQGKRRRYLYIARR